MKSKTLLPTLFVCAIILTTTIPSVANASPTTTIYVDPKYTGIDAEGNPLQPNGNFTINIKITDAYDVVSWSSMLFWDPDILNATKVVEGTFLKSAAPQGTFFIKKTGTLFDPNLNRTLEYLDIACGIYGYEFGQAGNGILASITFIVETIGETSLDLRGSLLFDHFVSAITHDEIDGNFSNAELHDIAVTGITVDPTIFEAGDTVYINVTVENQGDASETFNVTAYYDENVIDEKLNVTLDFHTSKIVEFAWSTPSDLPGGDYTIKAVASFVPEEADTADNIFIDGKVSSPEHDIAVFNITADPKKVIPGQTVSIDVTVKNNGDFTETFDVAVYYDSTLIATKSVSGLEPNQTGDLSFVWDTSGVPEGGYRIKAVAGPVSGEVNTGDNSLEVKWQDAIEVSPATQSLFMGTIGVAVAVVVVVVGAIIAFIFRQKLRSFI